MSDIEVEENTPIATGEINPDALATEIKGIDDKDIPKVTLKKGDKIEAEPLKLEKKACLLYDGTEDSSYMCVRMARDKEYELCVCVPKGKDGDYNKNWNALKNIIQKENNQTKFHNLSHSVDDLEGCCNEVAATMLKDGIPFLFIGWTGERFADVQGIYRKLYHTLPTTLMEMGKGAVLRVDFPNMTHSQDFIQSNRQNLGINKIFGENPKPKKEEEPE